MIAQTGTKIPLNFPFSKWETGKGKNVLLEGEVVYNDSKIKLIGKRSHYVFSYIPKQ